MCFSATASFVVAATTGTIGLAALRQVKRPHEYPLAAVPLLFAAQQAVEGVLWLQLPDESGSGTVAVLAFAFLIFAEVLWPTYTALAVLLVEPDRRRRRIVSALAVLGFILSVHLLTGIIGDPPMAVIRGHSIGYTSDATALSWQHIPYLICTCLPLLLSSHRIVQAFGAVITVSFLISAYVYFGTFISVWCFFAAADSSLLYLHFRRAAMGIPLHRH